MDAEDIREVHNLDLHQIKMQCSFLKLEANAGMDSRMPVFLHAQLVFYSQHSVCMNHLSNKYFLSNNEIYVQSVRFENAKKGWEIEIISKGQIYPILYYTDFPTSGCFFLPSAWELVPGVGMRLLSRTCTEVHEIF